MLHKIFRFLKSIMVPNSIFQLLKQILFLTLTGILAISIFFYIYLPISTNHSETLTVPDITGIHVDELDYYLSLRNLRYEISEDSGYSSKIPPLTVLKQFPMPYAQVKEFRKIYLTLNSMTPPVVKMPDLTNGSLKNALMILNNYDLKFGKTKYVADLAFNAVLIQKMNGEEIIPGTKIPKGSVIDLTIGDGYGNSNLESPYLIGLDADVAQVTITGSALKLGNIVFHNIDTAVLISVDDFEITDTLKIPVEVGQVVNQYPAPGEPMVIKESVNLWIYHPDSVNHDL
ncbi:MAG: penicillin-binding protein [Flammeovirgaceae bacterium]|nr:penicillin-binding protein [Flammeovirgaceae bacterium]